jgi:hypothetical protein
MADLSDRQHEDFAQFVAAGLSKTAAAVRAGFPENSAANTGCRLAKRPEIHQRIDELMDIQKNTEVPKLQWLIAQAIEIERAAIAAEDYSAANRSLELLARMGGFLNERKESPGRVVNLNLLDTGQIIEILRVQCAELTADDREALLLASPELAGVFDTEAIEAVQQSDGAYGKPVDVGDCNPKSKGKRAEPE